MLEQHFSEVGLVLSTITAPAQVILNVFLASLFQQVSPLFFGKVVDASMTSMDELTETSLTLFGIYMGSNICTFFRSESMLAQQFTAVCRDNTDHFQYEKIHQNSIM